MTRNSTKCGTYAPKQWSAKDGTLTTANYPSAHMMTICAVTLTRIQYATPNLVALLTPIIMIINLSIEEHMALTRCLSLILKWNNTDWINTTLARLIQWLIRSMMPLTI